MRRKEIQQARFGLGGLICHPYLFDCLFLLLSGAGLMFLVTNSWLLYECKGPWLAASLCGDGCYGPGLLLAQWHYEL